MVSAYQTEEEQIQAIKQWWQKNGSFIVTVVAIFMLATGGWRYWQHHQAAVKESASVHFDLMLQSAAKMTDSEESRAKFDHQAKALVENYPKTIYAQVAALMQVRQAVNNQDWALAQKQLHWVLDHAKDEVVQHIARLRLARILTSQHQYDKALALLDVADSDGYTTLYEETKGDIYLLKKDKEKAKIAYQKAMDASPLAREARPLLAIKLDELA